MDLEWLRAQLNREGYSQAELARRLGLAPSGVSKILNGTRRIIAHEADIIRDYVGREPANHPPAMQGRPDIPLWASAAAGDEGAMILTPDPIDYLWRSERMQYVRSPFAFNVLGSSMMPAIGHGDQVIVNPSIVARPGHDCVFIHDGADGMFALVKRLLKERPEHWQVRQFSPAKDFDIPRKKWPRVHPIAEIRRAGM